METPPIDLLYLLAFLILAFLLAALIWMLFNQRSQLVVACAPAPCHPTLSHRPRVDRSLLYLCGDDIAIATGTLLFVLDSQYTIHV
ncbi:hypothetical protein E2542_SST22932 [Spatholobus suberectus]|nr:hypothetical protein E2542_SST22932 [Spatholobus suberectus]